MVNCEVTQDETFTPINIVFDVFASKLIRFGSCEIFTVDIVYPNRISFPSSVFKVCPDCVMSSGIYDRPTDPYTLI